MRTKDRFRANFNPQIRRKNVKMSGGVEQIELQVQAAAMAMPMNVNDNAGIVLTTFVRPDLNITLVLSYHR